MRTHLKGDSGWVLAVVASSSKKTLPWSWWLSCVDGSSASGPSSRWLFLLGWHLIIYRFPEFLRISLYIRSSGGLPSLLCGRVLSERALQPLIILVGMASYYLPLSWISPNTPCTSGVRVGCLPFKVQRFRKGVGGRGLATNRSQNTARSDPRNCVALFLRVA